MDTESAPLSTPPARPPASPSFDVHTARDGACPLIFLCDHATNDIPAGYKDLGVGADQLRRHIAYDIGAGALTNALREHFGAAGVATRFSRLLIDPNRAEDDPTLIMRIADGALVPGNRRVDAAERNNRLKTYYRPYHDAITQLIDATLAGGVTPVLISIHSFTEAWKGMPRPWQIGILWDADGRIAEPLLEELRRELDLVVGDNEPYSGSLQGDTMWRHGTMRDLPHALIEVRQDLIRDRQGQALWAGRLAHAIGNALAHYQAKTRQTATGGQSITL